MEEKVAGREELRRAGGEGSEQLAASSVRRSLLTAPLHLTEHVVNSRGLVLLEPGLLSLTLELVPEKNWHRFSSSFLPCCFAFEKNVAMHE